MVGHPTLGQCGPSPVEAGCSIKTWQPSVTRVATLAHKVSRFWASGGGWAATFATLDSLGEGGGLALKGHGASASTTTTTGPHFVCLVGLPPLSA